jgi:hypothetical protein
MYQFYRYNDHNNQNHYSLFTEYQLTEDPNVFKIILIGDYRNAAKDSISIIVGETLVDVIHPYWTPIKYFAGCAMLEYRHYYNFFDFCEAPQRYIDIKVSGGTDSNHNNMVQGILEWKHEFTHSGGIELKGFIAYSPQWQGQGAWATAYYRF